MIFPTDFMSSGRILAFHLSPQRFLLLSWYKIPFVCHGWRKKRQQKISIIASCGKIDKKIKNNRGAIQDLKLMMNPFPF